MRSSHTLAAASVLASIGTLQAAETPLVPTPISQPRARGDQVIFYYDVREGFTTFINLRNGGASELRVRVLFYGPEFAPPFAHDVTLPVGRGQNGAPGTGGLATIDVGTLKANGLPPQPGAALAMVVDATGAPVVTRVLSGNFTVAVEKRAAQGAKRPERPRWGCPARC